MICYNLFIFHTLNRRTSAQRCIIIREKLMLTLNCSVCVCVFREIGISRGCGPTEKAEPRLWERNASSQAERPAEKVVNI